MKKGLAILLALVLLLSMVACTAKTETKASTDVISLKLAHNVTIGATEDKAAQKFAELVKEKTNGTVEITIYGGGQLGDESALLEGLQLGTLDACLATSAYISNITPQFGLLDLPFLFADYDEVRAKLDSEAGTYLSDKLLSEQSMRVLGYWCSGFRVMLTKSAPIHNLGDIQNRKMRAPEVPVYIDMFNALGAAATPIPFGEVYTSINTNVVDGVEVCAEEMHSMKFYEVGNYIAITNHIFSTMIPVISEKAFSKLNADQQKAVLEAAKEACNAEWEEFEGANQAALEDMEASGVVVNELEDRDAWIDACSAMQDKYAKDLKAEDLLAMLRG